ncbi:MAG: glycine--tRNA ligase subunit beta [Rickettsia sp.]|nr:glycine--tRNA ligase subunit beta [Rickettsia sp.]
MKKIMYEFLLELFSEEMPSLLQKNAANYYKEKFQIKLDQYGLKYSELSVFYGPRRISLLIKNLNKFDSSIEEIKKILISITTSSLPSYSWSKSLVWDSSELKWGRPLRNISCIFNNSLLKFSFYHLVSNNYTYGHRSLNSKIFFNTIEEYLQKLEQNFIILDQNYKKNLVEKRLKQISQELGLRIYYQEKFLEDVLGRIEYPVVLLGKILPCFLKIPKEIVKESMIKHQKYFPLYCSDGNLASYFIFVSNAHLANHDKIIHLNEKILEARLEDALFFYEKDLLETSEIRFNALKNLNFHNKLGNFYDKSLRIVEICKFLSSQQDNLLITAAKYCKTDLVSNIVQEFPALQGIMGYYLSISQNDSTEIAEIIRDHYKPVGEKSSLPENKKSALLSVADKIDNVVGILFAGEKFSGSKDPFAIKRQIISIIRVILDCKLDINLRNLILYTTDLYSSKEGLVRVDVPTIFKDKILYFFKRKYQDFACKMLSQNFLDVSLQKLDKKLYFLDINKDSIFILSKLFKRCYNLIPKKISFNQNLDLNIDKKLENLFHVIYIQNVFSLKITNEFSLEEKNLFEILAKNFDLLLSKNHIVILDFLLKIQDQIEKFLDNSLINTQEKSLYQIRVGLLLWIIKIFYVLGNFNKIIL